ncbi:MAG TPA: PEPxxWA-CTERM sorting domain-containing protein, partial [Rhodanobacter sp.]|nr:PEPxxWA-CTERM sorting domain-containing protein [Rhodanobacter sp.]
QGVTYTSDSGVFLTGPNVPAGIPEPASWALIIVGLGIAGGALRRSEQAKANGATRLIVHVAGKIGFAND